MAGVSGVFPDSCVIYYAHADKRWIAHSLRTDQIGVGDCVVDALVDLMNGMKNLLTLAAADKTIAVFRDAPDEIKKWAKTAKPLPEVIFQIAHERFTNRLPKGYRVTVDIPKTHPLTSKISEPA